MAQKRIHGKLYTLIYEYETGIKDCFLRGYVKGRIETYGEIISFNRNKQEEPFHDYCMRLKTYLAGQVSNNKSSKDLFQETNLENRTIKKIDL